MNNNIITQLQQLNLSANEAKVYLALLETGQTSAGDIIKKTQLHRSVVYETFDKLIEKKLAFKLEKQNIAYFQANSPDRILQSAESKVELARELVPNLQTLLQGSQPEITVYEGVEAYRRFWLESLLRLPEGSTDYVAGSIGGPWLEYMGSDAKRYFKIAQKRNIGWKMIVFDLDDAEQSFLKKYPNFRWECRLIDKTVSKEGNFNVFGDKSVVLHSATEPMIIEIANSSLVRVFQNLFDIFWSIGRELPEY